VSLKEHRRRYGLTQEEVVAEVRKRALARGDGVIPGLNQCTVSRHENGHKRPGPYYQALYCEVYGATPFELGFRLALPGESSDHEDVDRREFIAGAAGLAAEAAFAALPVPPTRRLGDADVARLRQSVVQLYKLDDQHGGAGAVYPLTLRTFHRVRGLVERAGYDAASGRALRQLAGETAAKAGWLSFDAGRHGDARRWWLEATHWSRLADVDSVTILATASMAFEASDQRRPREAIDLATAAQRIAGRAATPRLASLLLAREALGHAGARDAGSAHAALRRARDLAETRRDDDPGWLAFYGPANFSLHEYDAAMMLGDSAAAEGAARAALALGDPVAYPRNQALYTIRLAAALVARREIDEGVAVASQAAAAAGALESARVTRGIVAISESLTPFTDDPGVRQFLDRTRRTV